MAVELFEDVDPEIRQAIRDMVDLALAAPTLDMAKQILQETRDSLCTTAENDFMDFYFYMQMEAHGINGESDIN